MELLAALRMQDTATPPRLALVGAGGKSTALFLLARQLLAQFPTVLVSASTHLAPDQAGLADYHQVAVQKQDLEELTLKPGVLLITGAPEGPASDPASRLSGLDFPLLQQLLTIADTHRLPLLVEADGARRLPLKAPGEHEPAIPGFAAQVIVVVGLSGLGKPLDNTTVHRPERFGELSGLAPGDPISIQALATVLAHPEGGLKNIPAGAQSILLLNQAETPAREKAAGELAEVLLPVYSPVLVAALGQPGAPVLAAYEPMAGIILAAGQGKRFEDAQPGRFKLLLEWAGEALVHRAARLAIESGLSPVRVVAGAHADELAAALHDLPVEIIFNPDWTAGQSTSVKAGLSGLPGPTGAAMFLLADQPFITKELLVSLRRQHALTLASLVAPWCGGRRANPAVFDRRTFPDLLTLSGDAGGRALFNMPERYTPSWLHWPDERLLLDIDTPDDYQRLKEMDA